jgi:hypothetical protein
MIDRAPPAYARRLRLSTGSIVAALLLTGAALLAVVAAVGRPGAVTAPGVSVRVEGPLSEIMPEQVRDDRLQASSEDDSGLASVRR